MELLIPFLGDRDYVDVSQISAYAFKHLLGSRELSDVTDIQLKIHNPITTSIQLVRSMGEIVSDGRRFSFSFSYKGDRERWVGLATDQKLTVREKELIEDPTSFVQLTSQEAIRLRPMSSSLVYEYMKLGKMLLTSRYNPEKLRVVSYSIEHLRVSADTDVRFAIHRERSGFVENLCLHNGLAIGTVLVKLNA